MMYRNECVIVGMLKEDLVDSHILGNEFSGTEQFLKGILLVNDRRERTEEVPVIASLGNIFATSHIFLFHIIISVSSNQRV